MSAGCVYILGLGPGRADWVTPRVSEILSEVTDIIGYIPYIARVADRPGLTKHASDNRVELDRARHALELADQGRKVAVVSGGDPGVFAMAAAVLEAIDEDAPRWNQIEIQIEPGITAMLAAAARIGAPLGADFVCMSLSDNLKPWSVIEKRLALAAEADFVMAFYNPASKARPTTIFDVFALLKHLKAGSTPVILGQSIGRPDETISVSSLDEIDPAVIDMRTLVIIGASTTKVIDRGVQTPLVYTPRFVREL